MELRMSAFQPAEATLRRFEWLATMPPSAPESKPIPHAEAANDLIVRRRRARRSSAEDKRVVEHRARMRTHDMLIRTLDIKRRALAQIVIEHQGQLVPLGTVIARRCLELADRINVRRSGPETGTEEVLSSHVEVVELPRRPGAAIRR